MSKKKNSDGFYCNLSQELAEAEVKIAKLVSVLKLYAEGTLDHIIEVDGKKHWIKEFGCGCCAMSYDIDADGTMGSMNCDVEDVSGWMARQTLTSLVKDKK